jgi:phosphoribosylaminoimidazole-succinocarboxamide synthase
VCFQRKIWEGKTKIVFSTKDPNLIILKFKDDITALDGKKRDVIPGKGRINASVSSKLFTELERRGILTHFVKMVNSTSMLVRKLDMIKIEIVCRNYVAGQFARRFPMFKEGAKLSRPLVEFYLKSDELGDPLLTEDHAILLGLTSRGEALRAKALTLRVNEALTTFMAERNLKLVDFKLELGRDGSGKLRVGDELDADCMRLWDSETGNVLDKDVYRKGASVAEVQKIYGELYRRVVGG